MFDFDDSHKKPSMNEQKPVSGLKFISSPSLRGNSFQIKEEETSVKLEFIQPISEGLFGNQIKEEETSVKPAFIQPISEGVFGNQIKEETSFNNIIFGQGTRPAFTQPASSASPQWSPSSPQYSPSSPQYSPSSPQWSPSSPQYSPSASPQWAPGVLTSGGHGQGLDASSLSPAPSMPTEFGSTTFSHCQGSSMNEQKPISEGLFGNQIKEETCFKNIFGPGTRPAVTEIASSASHQWAAGIPTSSGLGLQFSRSFPAPTGFGSTTSFNNLFGQGTRPTFTQPAGQGLEARLDASSLFPTEFGSTTFPYGNGSSMNEQKPISEGLFGNQIKEEETYFKNIFGPGTRPAVTVIASHQWAADNPTSSGVGLQFSRSFPAPTGFGSTTSSYCHGSSMNQHKSISEGTRPAFIQPTSSASCKWTTSVPTSYGQGNDASNWFPTTTRSTTFPEDTPSFTASSVPRFTGSLFPKTTPSTTVPWNTGTTPFMRTESTASSSCGETVRLGLRCASCGGSDWVPQITQRTINFDSIKTSGGSSQPACASSATTSRPTAFGSSTHPSSIPASGPAVSSTSFGSGFVFHHPVKTHPSSIPAVSPAVSSTSFGSGFVFHHPVQTSPVAFRGRTGRVTCFSPYSPTPEENATKLMSISAMPIYQDKSHEELRWEDLHVRQ